MKKITLLMTFVLGGLSILNAQVIATGSYSVGVGAISITDVTSDADNGDGVGDGAKQIDGDSATAIDEAVYFTFDGTIEDGTAYTINTTLYNVTNNFCVVSVALFNKTDGTELASINTQSGAPNGLQGMSSGSPDIIVPLELMYTAVAADAGDVLEVRFVKTQAGSSRNYAIDVLNLNGTPVSNTVTAFSAAGTWSVIGNTEITNTIDDADNGDGAADGSIFVDGLSVVVGQGAAFTFDETMEEGDVYTVATNIYNPGNSFNKVDVYLYNVTDGTQLTTPTTTNLPGASGGVAIEVTVGYTAATTDEGDVLELRYVKNFDGNMSRDFSIDNASINGSVISTDITALSIDSNFISKNISVFPNPTNNTLHIEQTNTVNIKNVKLIDITGKVMYNDVFKSSIDVANFSRGLYILKLESQTGSSIVKKVVLK